MPRHATYIPHGVIPAVLLPFDNDLAIDEASFRKHLRDVAATDGLTGLSIVEIHPALQRELQQWLVDKAKTEGWAEAQTAH